MALADFGAPSYVCERLPNVTVATPGLIVNVSDFCPA